MKKTEKLSILISIVLISLLAISAVSAAETDELVSASNDAPVVEDSQDTSIAKESGSPEPVKEAETDVKVSEEPKKPGTFTELNNDINGVFYGDTSTTDIYLERNYTYNEDTDGQFKGGITLSPGPKDKYTLTIHGNGFTIDASDIAGEIPDNANIFLVDNGLNLIIENLNLINAKTAINVNNVTSSLTTTENVKFEKNDVAISNIAGGSVSLDDTTFVENDGTIESTGYVYVKNSTFEDNGRGIHSEDGSVIISGGTLFINNYFTSIFSNNSFVDIDDAYFIGPGEGEMVPAIIAINNTAMYIDNTSFINNTGSIIIDESELYMDTVAFINDTFEAAIMASNSTIGMYRGAFINGTAAIFATNSSIFANESAFINNIEDDKNLFEEPDEFNAAIVGRNGTEIEIYDSIFENNTGAIDIVNGTLFVDGTGFINNTATNGGAIYFDEGKITIEDSAFIDNFAEGNGGAIYVTNSNATISADFTNNSITSTGNNHYGGAIYLANGNSTISGTFINNTGARAGAIYNNGKATITGTFTNNTATYRAGGAIFNDYNGNVTISGIFTGNEAISSQACGGSIYNYGGYATIEADFINNTAGSNGGAISARTNGDYEPITIISKSKFTGNEANNGGAIENQGLIHITESKFTDNEAEEDGGAIYTTYYANITKSKFIDNLAAGNGGAIANTEITDVNGSEFEANYAGSNGGAIYNTGDKDSYAMTIMDSKFTNDVVIDGDGMEIYAEHVAGDYYGHTRLLKLVGNTFTNSRFDVDWFESEPEDEFYVDEDDVSLVYCIGCIEHQYNKYYFAIANFNYIILNNATGHLAIFFNLTDDFGDPYIGEYEMLNITGDINDVAYSWVPYLNNTNFTVGQHTITVKWGGDYSLSGYAPGNMTITFNITQNVETLEKQLDAAEKLAKDLADKLAEAQGNATKLAEQLAEAQGNATKLQTKVNDLTAQLDASNQQVQNLTAKLNDANAEITTTKAALDAANTQITTLTTTNTNLQSQLTATKNDANAKIKKVKAPKKVKKSKKLKITVTLSKKINGKYVYVIFNGKSYKAKAKNGVAKITIKKSALKKLGGKKIKYQIVYNQSLKNKTVKIKK